MLETVPEEQHQTFLDTAIKEFARRGLRLYVLVFAAELLLFFVISSLPFFFPGEQALFTSQSKQIGNEFQSAGLFGTFVGIFTNNYRIALIEFIPVVGVLLFALSVYETARIVEVEAIANGVAPAALVLLLLFYPHTYIELPAYAVAVTEGLILLYAIIRWLGDSGRAKKPVNWRAEWVQFWINVGIVTAMLLVAALFESVEIELELVKAYGGFLFLVTWIPFVGLIALVLMLYIRLRKIRAGTEPAQLPVQ